jgi:hypothetical protein
MTAIKHLRRISPLAAVFVALAVVLALTPSAHAQSTATVKLKATGLDPSGSLVAAATPRGETTIELNSEPSFFQRWTRDSLSNGNSRFSRLGFLNACMRIPDSLSPTTHGVIVLGSCSGTRAEWRRINGNYINAATGHYMSPPLCLINPCDHRLQAFPAAAVPHVGASLMRWSLRFL